MTAVIVVAVALMLQPIRDYFDAERKPDTKLSFGDLSQTMRMVLDNPPVRDIAFAAFAFGGLQSLPAGFFILYLIDGLNYSKRNWLHLRYRQFLGDLCATAWAEAALSRHD